MFTFLSALLSSQKLSTQLKKRCRRTFNKKLIIRPAERHSTGAFLLGTFFTAMSCFDIKILQIKLNFLKCKVILLSEESHL